MTVTPAASKGRVSRVATAKPLAGTDTLLIFVSGDKRRRPHLAPPRGQLSK